MEVADTGNTVSALKGDVDAAVWSLNHYAGLGYELKGRRFRRRQAIFI